MSPIIDPRADQGHDAARPLGERLVQAGRLSQADLDKALTFQQEIGGRLGGVLTRLGLISEAVLLPVLAEQQGLVYAPTAVPPDDEAINAALEATGLRSDWFHAAGLIPWLDAEQQLHVAGRHPNDPVQAEILDEAWGSAHGPPVWHLISSQQQAQWLPRLGQARGGAPAGDEAAYLRELAEEAPVVSFVNNLLTQAVELNASDIHLEPDAGALRVRYRVDGILSEHLRSSNARVEAVISRVKLMSHLDIAERRLPQDGRISLQAAGRALDVRVSTLPGVAGESVVMRLLPKDRGDLTLNSLGLASDHEARLRHLAKQPYGMMLVTGPTGSGKSTTLYALLSELNNGERKIISVEDPVEYRVENVIQVQAHADIGYDFARALRAILRQDPDVIMIGEVRDAETARIAVQSSLTGHMMLSTLHTNDAISAFGRLIDMGVEPYLLASAVRGVLAQRLARRLCANCAQPTTAPATLHRVYEALAQRFPDLLGAAPGFLAAGGCEYCQGTGYRGRVGLYEWVGITPELAECVARAEPTARMRAAAGGGFRTLREDGLIKAYQGQTTLDEVLRVTGDAAEEDDAIG